MKKLSVKTRAVIFSIATKDIQENANTSENSRDANTINIADMNTKRKTT